MAKCFLDRILLNSIFTLYERMSIHRLHGLIQSVEPYAGNADGWKSVIAVPLPMPTARPDLY